MDTIFTNSKNSKTCNPHRLLLNFSDKINLIRSDKYVPLSNLGISIHGKIYKSHTKNLNLKYQLQHGMESLNYLTNHILYQIFKITLNILQKTWDSYS